MLTDDEIYAALAEIFRDVFARDDLELRPTLSAHDVPGWDSFRQIEIIIAAQKRFSIRMSTRGMDSLQNVGDLVRIVAAKADRPDARLR